MGAGDAWFAEQLATRTAVERIVCWDSGYTPDVLATRQLRRRAEIQLVSARPDARFDLLLLLDVLEHIADDRGFLERLVRENLVSGGYCLVSMPAWPLLFSSHDVRLRHERRYTPASARELLNGAGLEIVRSAGLFHSLVLPRAVQIVRERLTGTTHPPADLGQWTAPAFVTTVVRSALAFDGLLSLIESRLGWNVPGLSWWALCRKAEA